MIGVREFPEHQSRPARAIMTHRGYVHTEYNPRYFDEPEKYKPSRWYGMRSQDSEEFTAFSVGEPLSCLSN